MRMYYKMSFSDQSYSLTKGISKDEKKNNGIYFTPPSTIEKNLYRSEKNTGTIVWVLWICPSVDWSISWRGVDGDWIQPDNIRENEINIQYYVWGLFEVWDARKIRFDYRKSAVLCVGKIVSRLVLWKILWWSSEYIYLIYYQVVVFIGGQWGIEFRVAKEFLKLFVLWEDA